MIQFRASSFGYLMVEPKNKSEKLSETTKTHLIDVYVSHQYGRKEEIDSKFLKKGNEREEDGITLVSRKDKVLYLKNEEHLSNEYVRGTPDLFLGESIHKADVIKDTKLSWSAHTFFRAKFAKLNPLYYWQIMCYLWLTGAKKGYVSYCLVNGTHQAITDEKRRLQWSMGLIDPSASEVYKERCKQIEINHIFDLEQFLSEYPDYEFDNDISKWSYDIPLKDRVFEKEVLADSAIFEKMRDKAILCNDYINNELKS